MGKKQQQHTHKPEMRGLLIERFEAFIRRSGDGIDSYSTGASRGFRALLAALSQAEMVHFRKSGLKMLIDQTVHFEAAMQNAGRPSSSDWAALEMHGQERYRRGAWIEFPSEIACHRGKIRAFFLFEPLFHFSDGKDTLFLYLVREDGVVIDVFSQVGGRWAYRMLNRGCSLCILTVGGVCDTCRYFQGAIECLLTITYLMVEQLLARQAYEIEEKERREERPRPQRGEERQTPPAKYRIKVIDASRYTPTPYVPPSATPQTAKAGRSWVAEAEEEGNLERVKIRTRPFQKTYRSERYRESGLLGKTLYFEKGVERKQPRRCKTRHMIEVKASDYEEKI